MVVHASLTIAHILGVLLLAFALFLDVVSIYRSVRQSKGQGETPGYGCFPWPVYVASSILLWNSWRYRVISVLLLTAFHLGYQMILLSLRVIRDKRKT